MKFRKHWVREKVSVEPPSRFRRRSFDIEVCGGSDRSEEDARREARSIGARVRQAIASGRGHGERYGYADRPLREEVVDEIRRGNELIAVVSRNSYGAKVLNTAHAAFVDIDMELGHNLAFLSQKLNPWFVTAANREDLGFWTRLRRALGGDRKALREEAFQAALSRIEEAVEQSSRLGMRVYRTFAGYRCLVISHTMDPTGRESQELLERFQADQLYRRLCQVQECYRARLTPKFWRCDGPRPPHRFPFRDTEEEKRYRAWEQDYETSCRGYSACAYITTFGTQRIDAAVQPIVDYHDRIACADPGKLA